MEAPKECGGPQRRNLVLVGILIILVITNMVKNVDLNPTILSAGTLQYKAISYAKTEELTSLVTLPTMKNYDRQILYVHVGKTGGSSMNAILRANCEWMQTKWVRVQCFRELQNPESVLSHLVGLTIHTSRGKGRTRLFAQNNATSFLFSVRNPIARAVSAFNMEHLENLRVRPKPNTKLYDYKSGFYEECFPTIEELATVLYNKTTYNSTKIKKIIRSSGNATEERTLDCYNLAKKTLRGKGFPAHNSHLFANYKAYADVTVSSFPDKEVLVVRTEHLWDDIERLNMALADSLVEYGIVYNQTILHNWEETGSKSTFKNISGHAFSHGSENYTVKSGLSKLGKETLCCHMSEDNKIFEDIVRGAVNFDEKEKEKYLNLFYDDCGICKADRDEYSREIGTGFGWDQWASAKGCNVL